ncbi:YbaB/EbfC family nucleoid-associated protein [Nocardia sp. NPDC051787]|uniref:YbaB/EbfC family nucleoid-associated protein n=1 Tax=Nocardia sp. NPDC051787 TaxID=3155415 RepID=UPI00341CA42D
MANQAAKEQLAALMDSFRSDMQTLQQMQQQRARLSASASAAQGRVTVTVDADGIPANIEFSSRIGTLSYPEIAEAVLSAARDAAVQVRQQSADLVKSMQDPQNLPNLSDFLPGAPDLTALIPDPPTALLTPPETDTAPGEDDEQLVFTNVVELPPAPDWGVRDSGWHGDPAADPEPQSIDSDDDLEQLATSDSEVTDRGW